MGPDVILLDGPQSETGRRILFCPLAFSVGLGVILNFAPVDPIKALYWRAVTNGVLAAPVMVMLMLLVRNPISHWRPGHPRMALRPRVGLNDCDGLLYRRPDRQPVFVLRPSHEADDQPSSRWSLRASAGAALF
jgi:hypothetical protein